MLAIALEQLRAGRHATLPVGLPRPAANCGWKRGSGLHDHHANCDKQKGSLVCTPPRRDPHEDRQPLKPAHRAMTARHRRRGGKILAKELLGKDDGRLSLADWHEIAKLAALLDEAATDGRPA
jgi:hypothetical protein